MKILFVVIALVFLFVGLYLVCRTYLIDFGLVIAVSSMFFLLMALLTPVETEAHERYIMRGAGITQQMNVYLAMAMDYEELNTTEDEIDLLARLMTAEIGYSNSYGQEYEQALYLCGSVVINRINSSKYPNTLQDVIYQPHQYSCTADGHILRDYDELAWEIAEGLLQYGTDIDENVVYQSQFKQGKGVYEKIGRTYFCYD